MTPSTTGAARHADSPTTRVPGLPKPARRRRPVLVIVGLVVATLAAALVAALLSAATATTLVWATATDVSRGHPVQADELVAVELSETIRHQIRQSTDERIHGTVQQRVMRMAR